MDKAFHNNIDLKYNQLLNSRVENVSSLPSGLGLDHKGMVVSFTNKLYIWDGSEWNTWGDISSINNCCREVLYQTYYTDFVSGSRVSLGEEDIVGELTNDYCSYYGIRVRGEWSIDPNDNDQGFDFTNTPIYCSLLYREQGQIHWDYYITKAINYVPNHNETFDIDLQFIFIPETDVEIAVLFHSEPLGGPFFYPITSSEKFWKTVTVTKCPKNTWYTIADIPSFPKASVNLFSGLIPEGTSLQLPFIGHYSIDIYVDVREYDYDGSTLKSTTGSQSLRVVAYDSNPLTAIDKIVDTSGVYMEGGTHTGGQWVNMSLQGSTLIYVTSTVKKVYYEINLPNGFINEVLGGYMVIKYLGHNKNNQFLEN